MHAGYHGVVVDVVLKVVVWLQDSLSDDVVIVDTDSGRGRGVACVGQPCQFLCVLVVSIVQSQLALH